MKRFISIVLSFMICFMCVFELSANAYMLNSQIVSNEDENVIQSMLEKLETILNFYKYLKIKHFHYHQYIQQ